MSTIDEISGADLATVLDVVGAHWDGHNAYGLLMIQSMGLTRLAASSLVLVGLLLEEIADQRGLDRDQVLGVIRGAVA